MTVPAAGSDPYPDPGMPDPVRLIRGCIRIAQIHRNVTRAEAARLVLDLTAQWYDEMGEYGRPERSWAWTMVQAAHSEYRRTETPDNDDRAPR